MPYLARFIYELLLALSLPIAATGWVQKMYQRNGIGTGIKQRFGFYDQLADSANKGGIYIHAVSVGEAQIALKLITELTNDTRAPRKQLQSNFGQERSDVLAQQVTSSHQSEEELALNKAKSNPSLTSQNELKLVQQAVVNERNYFTLAVTTSTAWHLANDTIKNSSSLAAKVTLIYAPFDFSVLTRNVLQRFKPRQLILIESELWPNLMYTAKKLNIPVKLINARLSDRSFGRMLKWKQLINKIGLTPHWMSLKQISVSFERDLLRWQQLGFKPEQLHLTGNIKYDNTPTITKAEEELDSDQTKSNPSLNSENELKLAQQAVLDESEPMTKNRGAQCITNDTRAPRQSEEEVAITKSNHLSQHFTITAVSTHADEELLLMAFIAELREELAAEAEEEQTQTPKLEFIIIPRHVERCPDIIEHLAKYDFELNRDYQLIDQTGQVAQWLEQSDLAIIGKSFLKKGGQNPIEPLQHNVPVICGPYMSNFEPLISELKEANAISYCSELPQSENHELADMHEQVRRSIKQHISYPQIAQRQLQAAHKILTHHQGATAKAAALIES